MGTIECNMFHGLDNYAGMVAVVPGYDGRPTRLGAHGARRRRLPRRGLPGRGGRQRRITGWSPNAVEVRVEGARPGDHVVLNQNWDPGWSVSGADAVDYQHTIAGVLHEGTTTVRFRYRARGWWLGLLVWAATVGALLVPAYLKRRRPRAI